jgi:predicted hydrocarbon binding protein
MEAAMGLGALLTKDTERPDGNRESAKGLSPTTVIANVIRRSGRNADASAEMKNKIVELSRSGSSRRHVYQAGWEEGLQVVTSNLADVLYTVQYAGLGRAAVVEESNSHVTFRVNDCVCGRTGNAHGCEFVAGFLAGAMLATGRYQDLEVRESSCSEFPGRTCEFRAELKLKLKT